MKKVLAMVFSVIFIISVTACGSGNNQDVSDTSQTDEMSSSVETSDTDSTEETRTGETSGGSTSGTSGKKVATTTKNTQNQGKKFDKSHYTISAKGSPYATGIKLPKLSNPKITYMTNTTMQYIIEESPENSPTAIYHSMLIWKAVYGVDVEIEIVPWDNMTDYLITAVSGGSAPSVTRYANHPKWSANKLLTPLDDLVDLSDPDYDINEIKDYQFNGRTYVLFGKRADIPSGFLLYNATKFELNGVDTPLQLWKKGKWTFSQFVKTCAELTDKKNGDEFGFTGWAFYPGKYVPLMTLNKDGTVKLNIDNPKFIRYMTVMYNLYQNEGVVCNKSRLANWRTTFPAGKDAMVYTDLQSYTSMMAAAKQNGVKDKFKIAPMPAYDFLGETEPWMNFGDSQPGICMPSRGKNQEAAVVFCELYAKVMSNISKKNEQSKYGPLGSVIDNEEKAMLDVMIQKHKEGKFKKTEKDVTNGIGNSEQILSTYFISNIYYQKPNKSLSELIAYIKPLLETQIMEYEMVAGLR